MPASNRCRAWAGWALAGALCVTAAGARAAPPELHLKLCSACHGPDGNSLIADNPKLAGQNAEYLLRQIAGFKSGKRTSPVMSQIVATLDDDSLRQVVEYYAEQKTAAGSVTEVSLVAKGKPIFEDGVVASGVPACSSCHGNDGTGDAKYPRIAAQHPAYVEKQLLAFRSGERANDAKGVMAAVAKRMSDVEIRAVAQYLASMKED